MAALPTVVGTSSWCRVPLHCIDARAAWLSERADVAAWFSVDALLVALSAFGFSVVSAVSQVVPIEAYLTGLGLAGNGAGVWLVAAFAGAGHGLGKLAWYEVGVAAHRWARFRRWLERPRVKASYARWLAEFERRPRLVLLLLAASALLGFPPLAVTPTIAGQVRVGRWATFLIIAGGRTLRFAAFLGAVSWLAGRG